MSGTPIGQTLPPSMADAVHSILQRAQQARPGTAARQRALRQLSSTFNVGDFVPLRSLQDSVRSDVALRRLLTAIFGEHPSTLSRTQARPRDAMGWIQFRQAVAGGKHLVAGDPAARHELSARVGMPRLQVKAAMERPYQQVRERVEQRAHAQSGALSGLYRSLAQVASSPPQHAGLAQAILNDLLAHTRIDDTSARTGPLAALDRDQLFEFAADACVIVRGLKGSPEKIQKLRDAMELPGQLAAALRMFPDMLAVDDSAGAPPPPRGDQRLRRGDRFIYRPPGTSPGVEVEVEAVHGDTITAHQTGGDHTVHEIAPSELDDSGRVILGLGHNREPEFEIPEGLRARYSMPHPDLIYSFRPPPGVEVASRSGQTSLRIRGRLLQPGDGVRYNLWLEADAAYARMCGRVRAIGVDAQGRPEVTVDEVLAPGRLVSRKLFPCEIGSLSRDPAQAEKAALLAAPIPELQVTRPAGFGPRIRVGDDTFLPGDHVGYTSDTSGKRSSARILAIEEDPSGRPRVWIRHPALPGEANARTLCRAELLSVGLDWSGGLPNHRVPDVEVVRRRGAPPAISVKGGLVSPGELMVFDRSSPGTVPMVLDHVELRGDEDVIWIQEPVPLVENDDDPRARKLVSMGDHEVWVSMHNWPNGEPRKAAGEPPYEIVTRPLAPYEFDLMRHPTSSDRYHIDGLRNAGWRAYTDGLSGDGKAGVDTMEIRGAMLRADDTVVYRRGGREVPMRIVAVVGGAALRVAVALEGGREFEQVLTPEELLFVFPR